MTPALRFRRVCFAYSAEAGAVLSDVDLDICPGAIVALVGPSGCGKSTLLNLAAGLLRPQAGTVENDFQRTAYMFQEPRLLPWRTVRENIGFGLRARGVSEAERRPIVERLLRRLDLEPAGDRYPRELSGGMRQRVALGRALAVDPDLLLLDEPFAALDVRLREELHHMVQGVIAERGAAAVLVTHDLAEALRIGDQLVVMAAAPGRVAYRGTEFGLSGPPNEPAVHRRVAELLERPEVAAAFFGHRIPVNESIPSRARDGQPEEDPHGSP